MRFLLLTAFSLFISLNSFSQAWVDCGIKGGYGMNTLVNGNVWKEPNVEHLISPAYSFGGKLGLNFNLNYQITVDFLHRGASQKYLYQPVDEASEWHKTIKYNSFDIPLLFRHNSDNGSFLEIGPQMSFINKATSTIDGASSVDVKDDFNSTNFGAVLGFGSFMLGSNNTYLVLGIRVHYGFQDLLSSDKNIYYPVTETEIGAYDEGFEATSYKPTNPLSAVVYLEINYDLAYLVRSECNRTALRFF